jgi:mRNA interferase MazF
VKRGEIWTVSANDYAGKPRPAVIVQEDGFAATFSVTVCPLTTNPTNAGLFRLLVEPSDENGLQQPSRLIADKITTIPRSKVGRRIRLLADDEMTKLSHAIIVFLGLASTERR